MLHLLEELGKACGRALGTLVTPPSKGKEHSFTFVTLGFQKGTGGEMESPGPRDDGMEISGLCPTICCRRHSIHCPENPPNTQSSPECTAGPVSQMAVCTAVGFLLTQAVPYRQAVDLSMLSQNSYLQCRESRVRRQEKKKTHGDGTYTALQTVSPRIGGKALNIRQSTVELL